MHKKSIVLVWLMMTPHIGLGMGAKGVSVNTLNYAIREGRPKLLEKIIREHSDLINCRDKDGDTPIHVAIDEYNAAHIDHEPIYSDDESGDLERRSDAKRRKQEEILEALLESGADPNACDAHGDTPLDRLTREAPLMLRVGNTNFRAATPAHLVLYRYGGKSSKELEEARRAQLKAVRRKSGKRKRK